MSQILGNLSALTWQMAAMWAIGGVMIYLAICKEMEPTLLLPMGFGCDPVQPAELRRGARCWKPCFRRAWRTSFSRCCSSSASAR